MEAVQAILRSIEACTEARLARLGRTKNLPD
jgi:hypothetical protein